MTRILSLILLLALCGCGGSDKKEDPLLLPPKYAELPDPNHPENPTNEDKKENVEKLKELLLNSD